MKIACYCSHPVNVIGFSWYQRNHIKRLPLYQKFGIMTWVTLSRMKKSQTSCIVVAYFEKIRFLLSSRCCPSSSIHCICFKNFDRKGLYIHVWIQKAKTFLLTAWSHFEGLGPLCRRKRSSQSSSGVCSLWSYGNDKNVFFQKKKKLISNCLNLEMYTV